jgi:hypothetical protein
MNLLSHFACAARLEPAVQLGAVLPDLLGLFRRRPRLNAVAGLWERDPERPAGVEAVLAGIRFHHHVDVRFHHAPLFHQEAKGLRMAMSEASDAPGLKRFFAAHLLLELFYDHLLLEAAPDTSAAFYRVLDEGRAGLLPAFVLRHPEMSREPLLAFLDRIMADRFVEDYRSLAGVFYRTERMLLRHRQRTLDEAERAAVTLYFKKHAARLRGELLLFVESMQQWNEAAPRAGLPGDAPLAAGEARLPGR